jgi:hypothetical protein
MFHLLFLCVGAFTHALRGRRHLLLENLALRQQLGVLKHASSPLSRVFLLYRSRSSNSGLLHPEPAPFGASAEVLANHRSYSIGGM